MFQGYRNILFLFFCLVTCMSCDREDDSWIEKDLQKNLVTYEVCCNVPDVSVELSDMSYEPSQLTIKNHWRGDYWTMGYYALITVKCNDPDAMIEVKIYVNGALKGHRYGNNSFQLAVAIK